ncbi:molybdopterin synthase subunit MoaE [Orbus hercynius]|uniref:Molybdopterin synthase catalytic subunit n=1 Tax=Orbus hercynius TaxID=593135 RepID=A0A495RCA5_9GAMM|nr:molybdopterin synthase catalytic subunit MoaE [Orbus hercynius]RKS85093.1 molybdopterin synthase subunit MoaE [Orbus hercynius]
MNEQNIVIVSNEFVDISQHYQWLSQSTQDGAIVTFTGKVRSLQNDVSSLYLEHYQGMTENVLLNIIEQARERWQLNRIIIVHRVGEILANENIVYVGVSSAHRKDSFAAADFIMDVLKNEAPFWKKEKTSTHDNWVEAKKTDKDALKKWY